MTCIHFSSSLMLGLVLGTKHSCALAAVLSVTAVLSTNRALSRCPCTAFGLLRPALFDACTRQCRTLSKKYESSPGNTSRVQELAKKHQTRSSEITAHLEALRRLVLCFVAVRQPCDSSYNRLIMLNRRAFPRLTAPLRRRPTKWGSEREG